MVDLLAGIATDGVRQAVVATHSPVVAATPGARILEEVLELEQNRRAFLDSPTLFLRYLGR